MPEREFVLDSVLERTGLETDGFDCFREGAGYRLQLWGRLPSNWAGHLALHAYVAGIQVVTGDAMRTAQGIWASSFLLRTANRRDQIPFDFLNMARRGPRLIPEFPEPNVTVGIRFSHESPGDVFAQANGQDSVGLIAQLLRRFAQQGLRPRRFVLRTHGKEIEDWFWLEPDQASPTDLARLTPLESAWSPKRA